ncbi:MULTISPECIES: hypothetical protein [Bacillus cereus group]|uniref:Uncharacterized protein n=1 Tax=Bacillus cereus TaxID=1396 RepID=A0AAW5L649_BACCE|nr:hypothetical protein [Bacillus cereus]MCQ6288980.1 hypothetical protein [Bacillus cereus]MCQ6318394.1 hypothetical protein [Bacillus cereus]MCQ6330202.1 hypothetical protein [Bacillus cereus]MCQ6386008.1 hypothetical protein [Bacillus cereus]
MKTANQTLEMIVEQGVEALDRIEDFQELNNLQNKLTFQEYDEIEQAMLQKMLDTKKESYEEGFKQGMKFMLSIQK